MMWWTSVPIWPYSANAWKQTESLIISVRIALGEKLKNFNTISFNSSSSNLPVPKVSTSKDTGFATPIA